MDIRAIGMGLVFALMWSSAFTSVRIIVAEAPPLAALSVRFFIAGAIAVGIARFLGQSWSLTRQQWKLTILFGICQNALYLGFNFVAMQSVEASLAAIIASSLPLWVALAGWLIWGERVRALGVLGLVIGFAGVALITGTRLSSGVDPYGVFLCGLGVLALTFATLALKGASSGGNVLMVVGLQMLVGAVVLLVPALAFETWIFTPSWRLAAAFTYTIVVPGLSATLIWFLLVRRIGTVRASTFHFLNPFLGVAIAAVILGEGLTVFDVIGVSIATLGILAVQVSRMSDAT
jgi:drug/metabolite transporter (DMT)-like permease